ncbi:hypothetical protein [Agromyces sp. S2-1-8]|uniref:hypothetical protein n=1 Tax=Agromyces sp. S2-1-8 TaxID=2897180 RepID=UPI001E3ED8D7|nr:hypothetical protein [Agromyces sp. S2-1-8]MCD5347885.1 hypothetical protein [Agromyces sp. S2-1-8]
MTDRDGVAGDGFDAIIDPETSRAELLTEAEYGLEIEPASAEPAPTEDPAADPAVQGWRRVLRGNRVLWVLAAVAVVSLAAGVGLSFVIVSPGQAAADAAAPDAGPITVPVESRTLSNDVTIRGDAAFADSVEVKLETGELGGPAVVTGRVPEVGATLGPASVALEVTGRPVIVLPGELPAYRTLRAGLSGPDVIQLKQSLRAIGLDPGDVASNVFDSATADAVAALYERVGYPLPEAPEGTDDAVRAARDGVTAAEDQVSSAERALAEAGGGPSAVERVQLDNAVRSAERALAAAKASGDANAVAEAEDALKLARVERDAALAPRDTAAERAALESARAQLGDAQELLAEAETGTLAFLPVSEVLYLDELPRRVDEVMVERGSIVESAAMLVSGATLAIEASAAESDAELLKVGDVATLAVPDGSELQATITSVAPREAAGGDAAESGPRYDVVLAPVKPTDAQVQALRGQNVRVKISIGATDGEVLAVPLAALTAGPGGESRVEVLVDGDGAPSSGADAETRLVEVETGLAAEGFVEVVGDLEEGDLVVVGE